MAWFYDNHDLPFNSHPFVDNQECDGPFHHHHEPYQQPSFQQYYQPSHLPYHPSFHPTFIPCHPSHESLYPFEPPYGPQSHPFMPNQDPSFCEDIGDFQNQTAWTINKEWSHKDDFHQHMDSIFRMMEQQLISTERLGKEIEQQSQMLKMNFQENPSLMVTHTQEVKQVQKHIEESSLPFGNDPILIEIDSSTTVINEAIHDLSDNEVDEEIIVQSPQLFKNVIAQPIGFSSSDSTVLVDECVPISSCDAPAVEDASLHSTMDECDKLNDIFPCSCEEYQMCVDCYHEKCHLLVELQKKAFSEVVDSTIDHNAPCCTIDDSKHVNFEKIESSMDANVVDDVLAEWYADYPRFASMSDSINCTCSNNEWCPICAEINDALYGDFELISDSTLMVDSSVDVSENNHSLECHMHKIPIGLLSCSLVGDRDSKILIDKILHVNESFQQVLSCDLPPDLEKKNDCCKISEPSGGDNFKNSLPSSTLFPSISFDCNDDVVYSITKLDSTPSILQAQESFYNITGCLTPTDGSVIDFLGCDSYLESLVPKMNLLHLKSLHLAIFGWDTAICLSSLQAHCWKDRQESQSLPYILGPLLIDPEPPPTRKFNRREDIFEDKCMILIGDENFSFKRLKIL